jgi:hypothetical protein
LTFFRLPEDTFDDGQVFIEDGKCYYSADWKRQTHMAESIGKYLEYDKKEVNQLTKTLKKNLPGFMKDYPIKNFEKEFFFTPLPSVMKQLFLKKLFLQSQ